MTPTQFLRREKARNLEEALYHRFGEESFHIRPTRRGYSVVWSGETSKSEVMRFLPWETLSDGTKAKPYWLRRKASTPGEQLLFSF